MQCNAMSSSSSSFLLLPPPQLRDQKSSSRLIKFFNTTKARQQPRITVARSNHGNINKNATAPKSVNQNLADAVLNISICDGQFGEIDSDSGVLHGFPPRQKTPAFWNALITAAANKGFTRQAMGLYRQMKLDGFCRCYCPDRATIVAALNSCASEGDLDFGVSIHADSVKLLGQFNYNDDDDNVFVANSLLDMYSKCGNLKDAVQMFDEIPERRRNVVSWTCMISGFFQNGEAHAAIAIFRWMLLENVVMPNEFTFAAVLRACAEEQELQIAKALHSYIIRRNAGDRFLHNSLIHAYFKCGFSNGAEALFQRMTYRDVVSWTSMISGCLLNGMVKRAFILFIQMQQQDNVMPNAVTVATIIQGCSSYSSFIGTDCDHALDIIYGWIHGLVIKMGLQGHLFVTNSLIQMYFRNGLTETGRRMFDHMPKRNTESWNMIISGYAQHGSIGEALKIFSQFFLTTNDYLTPATMATLVQGCAHSGSLKWGKEIHGYLVKHVFFACTVVDNSLIDMYAKCKQVKYAHRLFERMHTKDLISWNTMILCYVCNDLASEALQLLSRIHSNGGRIGSDPVTLLTSLQACSDLAFLQQGEIIHGYIIRSGFSSDLFIGNALIEMYAKSGRLDLSEQIFEEMPIKDMSSWNSMISAYGIHGHGHAALRLFSQLQNSGTHQPNCITFVCVLSACAHSGLIEEGYECFNSMYQDWGIEPIMEHYACMVDLLGRARRVKEAEDFIHEMPLKPGPAIWGALLGACRVLGNVDVAERAAERLAILEPESSTWKVLLSNIYAGLGRWKDAVKLRTEMKGEVLKKEPGWSSLVEVRGTSFKFVAGDTSHPQSEKIYEMLDGDKEPLY